MSAGRLFHRREAAAVKARSLRRSLVRGSAKWLLVADWRMMCHKNVTVQSCPAMCFYKIRSFYGFPVFRKSEAREGRPAGRGATLGCNVAPTGGRIKS